jgi:hypothetical protein
VQVTALPTNIRLGLNCGFNCDSKNGFVVIGKKSYFGHIFPFALADCSTLCQKKIVYKKSSYQSKIKFITDNYLQIYKTLQLFTSLFTEI